MITAQAMVVRSRVNRAAPHSVPATQPPPMMAARSRTNPITEISVMRPGRIQRRYTPMKSAIGMVMATENTPHGDSPRALTTTRARMAVMITMISRVAMIAAVPPTRPSSSRAIWPSERPPRRIEKNRTR